MGHQSKNTLNARGYKRAIRQLFSLLGMALAFMLSQSAFADGTETLGTPSIAIAPGSDVIVAGVGLTQAQPDDIEITVPGGATVQQVLLYWEGRDFTASGDDTITVNTMSVTGTLIGGPIVWTTGGTSRAYRADITGLGLVAEGANTLTIGDMDFDNVNNGAGVTVVIDDGSSADIDWRDGNDLAFFAWAPPQDTTAAQTFTFPAATEDRVATLSLHFSAVAGEASGGGFRPSVIEVTVGGIVTAFNNLLDSTDGQEWDSLQIPVDVPAGATELTVQALSEDRLGTGGNPASFVWLGGGVTVPVEELETGCWFTGGQNIQVNKVKGKPDHSGGGNIYPSCSALPGDGGQWTHTDHVQGLHFQAQSLTVVECGNVEEIPPGAPSPKVTVNFIRATATGIIKGVQGNTLPEAPATAVVIMEDWGEPGRNDKYSITATGGGETISLDRAALENGGNFQIHQTSCN